MMGWLRQRLTSSIGTKVVMSLTGLGLFGFVITHMAGNLLIYQGADALNNYAAGLQKLGILLWVARAGLLAIFVIHVLSALKLTVANKSARPEKYRYNATVQASYASRTMPMSGVIILAFVVYHLAHFTFNTVGHIPIETDAGGHKDVFAMVVRGFQEPIASVSYIIAMVFLGLHMSHGLSSLFQSLGLRHSRISPLIRKVGPMIAWGVAFANISIPVSVWLRFIDLPGGQP